MSVHKAIRYFISLVWFVNGLLCKVLNIVPRHREIVSRILGHDHAVILTILIGTSEVLMAIWIITGIKRRLNVVVQILVIGSMNVIEFITVPDLLLFGKLNALFAAIFIFIIYFNEFIIQSNHTNDVRSVRIS